MILSALILSGTVLAGVGAMTLAGKGSDLQAPKTINNVVNNNNTVINNNQKINNNLNIKNSMNQSTKPVNQTNDNKALEQKITAELNRIEDELMEEMLQQFYMNNLENDIANKLNKK